MDGEGILIDAAPRPGQLDSLRRRHGLAPGQPRRRPAPRHQSLERFFSSRSGSSNCVFLRGLLGQRADRAHDQPSVLQRRLAGEAGVRPRMVAAVTQALGIGSLPVRQQVVLGIRLPDKSGILAYQSRADRHVPMPGSERRAASACGRMDEREASIDPGISMSENTARISRWPSMRTMASSAFEADDVGSGVLDHRHGIHVDDRLIFDDQDKDCHCETSG